MPSGFAADPPRRSVRFRRAMTALGDAAALVDYLCVKYYLFGIGVRWRAAMTRYDFCHAMDAMSLFAARGFAARGVQLVPDTRRIVKTITVEDGMEWSAGGEDGINVRGEENDWTGAIVG